MAWNLTKPLHMHPYKKTVVHKLNNTNHGPRLNLLNWCFHEVPAGKTALTFFLFHTKAWFHLSGYTNYQNHVYQFAEFTLFYKVPSYDVKTHVSYALIKLQLQDPFLFRHPTATSTFTHILTNFLKTFPIITELQQFSFRRIMDLLTSHTILYII
jgi:hypothetical protein